MPRLIASRALAIAAVWALGGYSSAAAENPSAVLSGHVQSDDGQPVPGVHVVAHLKSAPGNAPFSTSGRTEADGSFSISGLPKGHYQLCVHDRKQGYLDPCQWSSSPPSADVVSTEANTVPTITLKKGRLLKVRIVDDDASPVPSKAHPALLVGVWQDNGLFVTVPLKTSDSKGRVHAQYVPDDKPLQLSIASSSYVITDEQGVSADVRKGMRKQVDFPPGDQPIAVMFHIKEHEK